MSEETRLAKIESDLSYTRAKIEGIESTCIEIKKLLDARISKRDREHSGLETRVRSNEKKIFAVFIIGPLILAVLEFWQRFLGHN